MTSHCKGSPSSDQASAEGPALIPIVGKNIERGGESVFRASSKILLFLYKILYATLINPTRVYMWISLRKLAYV